MRRSLAVLLTVILLSASVAVAAPPGQDQLSQRVAQLESQVANLTDRVIALEGSSTSTSTSPSSSTSSSTTTSSSTSTSSTTTVPTTTTSLFTPEYPGQPEPGKMYWGAILQSQKASDLQAKHGDVGVHRTYWQWAETGQGGPDAASPNIDQAIARGWLPVVSFKTPAWGQVAAGQHDAQLDKILNMLKGKQVPVWVIFYHEPEDNLEVGSPAQFVAMQAHIRSRMQTLGVNNVALGLCLMGFTWDPYAKYPDTGQLRNPDDWWGPNIYDFVAVDSYAQWVEDPYLADQEDWADAKGTSFVIGEWGYHIGQHGATRSWTGDDVRALYERSIANGTDAVLVFDSDANGYTYVMPPDQDAAFKQMLADPRTQR